MKTPARIPTLLASAVFLLAGHPSAAGHNPPARRNAQFQFASAQVAGVEGNEVTVTVTRTGNTNGRAAVEYGVASANARAGRDFTAAAGTLVFAAGQAAVSLQIPLIDDGVAEPVEHFFLYLKRPPRGSVLGKPWLTRIEISDRPPPPPVCAGEEVWRVGAAREFRSATLMEDGSIWLVDAYGQGPLVRLLPTGVWDTAFTPEPGALFYQCSALPGGKAFASGLRRPAGAVEPEFFRAILGPDGRILHELPDRDGSGFAGAFADGSFLRRSYDLPAGRYFHERTRADLTVLWRFNDHQALFPFDDPLIPNGASMTWPAPVTMPDSSVIGVWRAAHPFVQDVFQLIRLTPDGALDRSFLCPVRGVISGLLALPSGQLLVAGDLTVNGQPARMVRVNPNGSVDGGFALDARLMPGRVMMPEAVDATGRIIVSVNDAPPLLRRLWPDGRQDMEFTAILQTGGLIFDWKRAAVLPGGQVLAFGRQAIVSLHGTSARCRGLLAAPVETLASEADSSVTITLRRVRGAEGSLSAGLTVTGGTATVGADLPAASPVVTFGPGEWEKTVTVRLTNDALVESGESFSLATSAAAFDPADPLPAGPRYPVTILDDDGPPAGAPDLAFASGLPAGSRVFSGIGQPGGSALLRAYVLPGRDLTYRIGPDGAVDPSLQRRVNMLDTSILAKGLADGSFMRVDIGSFIQRYTPDGEPDPLFARAQTSRGIGSLVVLADRSVVYSSNTVFGSSVQKLFKLRPDGTPDSGFTHTPQTAYPMVLDAAADGSLLVREGTSLVRLAPDGSPVSAFSPIPFSQGTGTAFWQADEKIITFHASGLERFNSDGTPDPSFSLRLPASEGAAPAPLAVWRDEEGRLLVIVAAGASFPLFRLAPDGSADPTFYSGSGFDAFPTGFANDRIGCIPLTGGDCLFHGAFTRYDGVAAPGLVRVKGGAR